MVLTSFPAMCSVVSSERPPKQEGSSRKAMTPFGRYMEIWGDIERYEGDMGRLEWGSTCFSIAVEINSSTTNRALIMGRYEGDMREI